MMLNFIHAPPSAPQIAGIIRHLPVTLSLLQMGCVLNARVLVASCLKWLWLHSINSVSFANEILNMLSFDIFQTVYSRQG